jgi:hypothetical protein
MVKCRGRQDAGSGRRREEKAMKTNRFGKMLCAVAAGCLMAAGVASAAMDHGGMAGMDHGSMVGMSKGDMTGHDAKMGDKAFAGKAGPFDVEVRLVDAKAMADAAAKGGMKIDTSKMLSHHVQVRATDAAKKPVENGEATAKVTGPDGKARTYKLMSMADHMGSDVDLAAKGKYSFEVTVTAGGQAGTAKFAYTFK